MQEEGRRTVKKKGFIIFFSLILICLYIGRVAYLNINNKGFRVETEAHKINESFIYSDFQYKMLSFKILSENEMEEEYNIEVDDNVKDRLFLLAEFNIKYIGTDTDITCPIYRANMEFDSWRNGMNSGTVNKINTEDLKYRADEEKTYIYVSTASPLQFTKSEWTKVRNEKFNLVLGTYPKKVEIQCY